MAPTDDDFFSDFPSGESLEWDEEVEVDDDEVVEAWDEDPEEVVADASCVIVL